MLFNFTPMIVLLFDWMLNRIYLSIVIMSIYPLFGYAAYFSYMEIIRFPATANPISELKIFVVYPVCIGWILPILVPISLYLGTRVKFFVLGEGESTGSTAASPAGNERIS